MIDYRAIAKQQFASESFLDSREQNRRVVHSRVYTDEKTEEVRERIAEEIYRVFAVERK